MTLAAGSKLGPYEILAPIGRLPPRKASGQLPAGWSSDGRFLYLYDSQQFPANVWRMEVSTGRREIYREIHPSDPTGAARLTSVAVSGDEKSYAYAYSRALSELYVVEGVK
jgi:hypothetical protein